MIDFLAGNREKAISFLQSEYADPRFHTHTMSIAVKVGGYEFQSQRK
ncbi:hypothetical protein IQ244_23430 [Nostoc sp. LEGE 06077]|nr:hypothetical protein [Nostoc sp. LEGE 06077]MBE9209398.1 hypothetical protein [Nostoc sp. LEGE 06077]